MNKNAEGQPTNIYDLHDSETAAAVYTEWAPTYEHDLQIDLGNEAHLVVAQRLASLLPDRTARILDAGCGTGLCGQALHAMGFTAVAGLDLTEAMLDIARAKHIYTELKRGDLTLPLSYAGHEFDAVVSSGVFSHGPVLPQHLEHMLASMRSGGIGVHTINAKAYDKFPYADVLEQFSRDGIIELISRELIRYNVNIDVQAYLVSFRKA